MSILDQSGKTMLVGGQENLQGMTLTLSSYIFVTSDDGKINADKEDFDYANGARAGRLVYKRDKVYGMELMCCSDAVPLTDFPEENYCGVSALSSLWVNSAKISKSRGIVKVAVELENLGFTK